MTNQEYYHLVKSRIRNVTDEEQIFPRSLYLSIYRWVGRLAWPNCVFNVSFCYFAIMEQRKVNRQNYWHCPRGWRTSSLQCLHFIQLVHLVSFIQAYRILYRVLWTFGICTSCIPFLVTGKICICTRLFYLGYILRVWGFFSVTCLSFKVAFWLN